MYLTRIDKSSGLLLMEDGEDGIIAIREFRDILNNEKLGLHCLTAIALAIDYQSPIKFYSPVDRPLKAMEESTGDRRAFDWNTDIIQRALKKYDSLQYDPTLEEGRIFYDQKVQKLKQMQLFSNMDTNQRIESKTSMTSIKKELREINKDILDYDTRIEGKDIYKESRVTNGYTLSRLEQKLEKKISFYTEVR
jgi:hypothetical protein